jgi:hypothetical protein
MQAEPRILYVENDPVWLDRLPVRIKESLSRCELSPSRVQTVARYEEARDLLSEPNDWDLVVTDIGLADDDKKIDTRGRDLVSIAQGRAIPCVVVTGTEDITTKLVRDLLIDHQVLDVFDKSNFNDEDFIATVQMALLNPMRARRLHDPSHERASPDGSPFSSMRCESPLNAKPTTPRLFFSYSHKDDKYLKDFRTHLTILVDQGYLALSHDGAILPGQVWDDAIRHQIESANILCFLLSPDFLASRYCIEVEMKRALVRHEKGQAAVLPVILRPCDLDLTPFAKFQALPKDGRPVMSRTTRSGRDSAWMDVARGIRRVVDHMQGH